ncbi:MAG TPA: hypothetical protein VK168_13570 [Saprospiraceae bacterium]|nr:hypothetical protein [Saprospiraceae bacterium]
MFTIFLKVGLQSFSMQVHGSHSAMQLLETLRQNRVLSRFQQSFHLAYNGEVLSPDLPISHYGIGPQAILEVVSVTQPGFGGGGRETLLQNLLQAFAKLKKL